MYYEDENDKGFWDDEPTRPLERMSHRLKPAGNPPPRPTRPWTNAGAGRRSHTGEIPVVPVARRGSSRPSAGLGDMAERLLGAARNVRRPQSQPRIPRESREAGQGTFAAGIDPLMRRLGSLVLIIVMAIPVAIALRSGSAEGQSLRPDTTTLDPATTAAPTGAPIDTGIIAATIAIVAATEPATVATEPAPTPVATPAATQPPATTAKPAPVCNKKYTVVRGDSWSRIAGKVNVNTGDMLDANNATARTLLLPGKTVCLPANATATTTAPPTTAPRPTPTTAKPAPTNTTPPLVKTRAYSKAEVEAIIRSVWPAELVDWALKQAWKESNYQNNAYNSCCYGLYQLNFNAHKTWLARCGVTTPSQLFDPRVNTEMAVIVFRRMGGQGPWTGPIPCA